MATPLLVALVVIETSDLVFALDSIPAVFAITRDPFLVYTSNVFALLGLRSLYFVLAGSIQELRFLRAGLAVMLLVVAGKILVGDALRPARWVSLVVIAVIFGTATIASRLFPGPPAGRAILEKLLQRVERFERLARRQRVGIERVDLLEQARSRARPALRRCRAWRPGEQIALVIAARGELVEPREIRLGLPDRIRRHARELRHRHAVAAVGGTVLHRVQEHDAVAVLGRVEVHVGAARQLRRRAR